jgi:protein TonB
MSEGGFLEQKRSSPTSLAVVLALHGVAIAALMLAKGPAFVEFVTPLKVKHIPQEVPPPPEPQPQPKPEARPETQVTQIQPRIRVERPVERTFERIPDLPVVFDPGPVGEVIKDPAPQPLPQPVPEPLPVPKPEPVRREAAMLASSGLQPPYPASEQRAENEGSVTVRVRIGTDGRIKSVEKIKAASEAFYLATERQALRHWRFKPATEDGKPVESVKIMVVHFRLTA